MSTFGRLLRRINTSFSLKNARCPAHADSINHRCHITVSKCIDIKVFGRNNNFITAAANVFCGNRESKKYNVLKHRHKFKLGAGDYIQLPFKFVMVQQAFVTLDLYKYINISMLRRPGDGPGQIRTKLLDQHHTEASQSINDNYALKQHLKKEVINLDYLHLIEEDIIKQWIKLEKEMDMINYRMAQDALIYDWTYGAVKNIRDTWDVNELKEEEIEEEKKEYSDEEEEITTKQHDGVTKNLYHIEANWFGALNRAEMVLSLKPTPRKSEKHEYSVPELTDIIQNMLLYCETDIHWIILKCDGLIQNVNIPYKIAELLIERHGPVLKGYDLKDFGQNRIKAR